MIGSIIGDIVGSIYEFSNIKTKEFPLFSKYCEFTDDSILTVAIGCYMVVMQQSTTAGMQQYMIVRWGNMEVDSACGSAVRSRMVILVLTTVVVMEVPCVSD